MKNIIIRALSAIISFAFILLYIGPVITVGEVNIGTLTGFGIAFVLLIYAIWFDKINLLIKNLCRKKAGKIFVKTTAILLSACIALGGATFLLVLSNSNRDKEPNQVAIVLGCQVNGYTAGHFLQGRINTAYEFLNSNPDAVAILSGGQGNGESISEAECMRAELVEKGIEPSRLYIEDKSTSTAENFKNSIKVMESNSINTNRVTVITNDFHEYRASMIAKKYGLTVAQYPSKTPWNGYMPFATREIYAIIIQVYLNRI